MLRKLRNALFKPEGMERAGKGTEAAFELRYGNLLVGTLRHHEGRWTFSYSEEYKKAPVIRPIVDFPVLTKHYEDEDLWPFFASRIPSLENPWVRVRLAEEKVSEEDESGLLRLFGRRTITNPMELVAVA